jgi:uncharacterized membrane protein YkoI
MILRLFTGMAAILVLAMALWTTTGGARADDDHERARRALEAGEVVPLREILDVVERDFRGEIVEVELERETTRWIYEIRLLAPGGRLLQLEYDAHSKELVKARGRDLGKVRSRRHGDRDDD